MDKNTNETFGRLVEIVQELRLKCPWDKVQTKETLRHLTIEEVYELSEGILNDDWSEMKGELGDLLLHVLFYALIAEEQNQFTTQEMIQTIIDKLIRRHPHIYGDVTAEDAKTVIQNWEQIKLQEKKDQGEKKKTVLSGVPEGLPSLIKALRIQDKVSGVGFDWKNSEEVWEKVQEEMEEFHVETQGFLESGEGKEKVEQEFGDLIFSLVNYARFLNINPEDALSKTNRKFKNRFEFLENEVAKQGRELKETSTEEMEELWQASKKLIP